MRGHGEGNLINILLLSPWQGSSEAPGKGLCMWQEELVASLLRAGVSLALGPGRVEGWQECSEEDPKDGNSGSEWLNGGCTEETACLGWQSLDIFKLGLTLLDL